MKWTGYFLLLSGMGTVTLSMGWIAGYHGLGTILTVALIPFFLALLLALFINSLQGSGDEIREIERALNMRTAQLQDANRTIRRISTKDQLTGLYNKRGVKDMLGREITRSRRIGKPLVVLAINFRDYEIEDTPKRYSMMSILGKRLTSWMRETDLFARVSEDTLAFLLLDTDEKGAMTFLERLNQRLNGSSFQFPPFSAGITVFPTHGDSPELLIADAIDLAKRVAPGETKIFEPGSVDASRRIPSTMDDDTQENS
ncbi:GGDEF domain-containing protein [Myxococcota bacterium]|nr:GGDEF domain-containing protein [Myxococcota bacterium]MBU1536029.1 GGDEF domain-containing protein [Myxococcota bacterium]